MARNMKTSRWYDVSGYRRRVPRDASGTPAVGREVVPAAPGYPETMNAPSMEPSMEMSASNGAAVGVFTLVAGLIVVLALIGAVRLGMRTRRRESAPPRPEEQPRLPESGPVHELQEMREPDEVPRAQDGSERLTPHQLSGGGTSGSRRGEDQKRRRWGSGSA